MQPLPFEFLVRWILREYSQRESIFGIHRSLFFVPRNTSPYATPDMFGQHLATPIGPAAGPHTQLAQNIVCSWLSGGRFIELKTVQVMDELAIPRPCIDMEDEGYNVEWSQELKLEQSAGEYIKAWALIPVLHRLLGFEGRAPIGAIFNMSLGYNFDGITSTPMTRFVDRMKDASEELAGIRAVFEQQFPQFADVEIPCRISNNVTLSTMHGCPPGEIGKIARYLMEERGLHTTIKLNPTLLGRERVLGILHDELGFHEVRIPEAAFEHDLEYGRAVELIRSLKQCAARCGLTFGIKLSNTLAAENHKTCLPGGEMYLSGRALYPLTINLFHKLAVEFEGDLNVSYSGGADALNICAILASGARPVTSASDLLKPGGCSRLLQYLENIEEGMRERGAGSLDAFAQNRLANLAQAAAEALENPRYQKGYLSSGLPKVDSGLGLFDCVTAPCMERCAVCQDVPEYAWLIAQGEHDRALEVILARNPLPGITGYVCTHLCQSRCTRTASNYDEPVAIRALKRYAAEKGSVSLPVPGPSGRKVAVIGSGPSGLAAAYFLALNGIRATIFEARAVAGGMMRLAPAFRLPSAVIQEDIDRITGMGVEIRLSHPITRPPESLLAEGFDAVYIASGFQKDIPLHIEGIQGTGVIEALDLLRRVRDGQAVELGPRVLVIGGGDTALDAARVAARLTGNPVTVVYRRTRDEMPAGAEDQQGAFEEGILLDELASPMRVIRDGGRVVALECIRNRPGEAGADGRRRPVPIEGSAFRIEADSIIVAVGQSPDLTFLGGSAVRLGKDGSVAADSGSGRAGVDHIYAGGDVVGGPESIIAACAGGRRAAEAICAEFGGSFETLPSRPARLSEQDICGVKRLRAQKESQHKPASIPPSGRNGFELIESTLSERAARAESARCLQCSSFCDKCVEVCPNRANYTYNAPTVKMSVPVLSCPGGVLERSGEALFQVGQNRQIIHLHDLCNECGNCATFCVHQGAPYREKPRLYFDRRLYERESDNAFFVQNGRAGWMIRRREGGRESTLEIDESAGEIVYENDWVKAVISRADFRVKAINLKQPFPGELKLVEPAEMYVILEGLRASAPFLAAD
jgi:putative selenate reductase